MATLVEMSERVPNASSDSNSPSKKYVGEYYEKLGTFCDQCLEEGKGLQQDIPELKEMDNAIDYLLGLQWKEQMPSYRARPVLNDLLSCFWETIGLLTDIKPMWEIKDTAGQYSKIAEIENKLSKVWARQTGFVRKNAYWTMYAMLTTAPVKCYWDPFARGDSGDYSDADISMEVLHAKNLLRVGLGADYQKDECVIYRKDRTLNWIKRAYPTMGKYVHADTMKSTYTMNMGAPPTVMPQLFEALSPGAKRMLGADDRHGIQSVYPKAEVVEYWMKDDAINDSPNTIWMGPAGAAWGYWVKPKQKMYPRGRLIIRANRITLYDEPNPYFHRQKPFVPLALYDVPWQQYAMSVVSPWMKQTDVLNALFQGLLESVKKAVRPGLMASKSAIHPDSLRAIDSAKPNLKVSYSQNAATPPQWQQPPNIPGYVFNALGMIQKSMNRMSGGSAMDDALGKKQVPGGDTLDRITFSKSTPIRLMGRNIEGSVDEFGNMWTGTSLQFHDSGYRTEMLGEEGLAKEDIEEPVGTLIPEGINSEAFVRRIRYECDKSTLLNVARQDKTQIAFALRKNRDLSRKKLFKIIDWNINQEENDQELIEEAKQLAQVGALAPPKGHK